MYTETKALLSEKCLQRRGKVLSGDSLFTLRDAPLYAPYVDDLRKTGAAILLQLRWSNYVVVECDSITAEAIRKKVYVRLLTPTSDFYQVQNRIITSASSQTLTSSAPLSSMWTTRDTGCGSFRYGPSLTQNRMLGTTDLHSMGITGTGVLLGMIDNGFRWRAHDCFNDLRVLGEYDFMFRDSLTANDSMDVLTQDGHGSGCLSIATGFLQDSLIGTAPGVSVLLAKTEDMRYERRIEEDRFAAAMEWLESRGVDITSSSVGYDVFDSTDVRYPYDSLNGRSSICARAVNIATSLGVICVTAAGNSGGNEKTIITPGDADSAFTVGAFRDDSLNVAGFTSKGPNAAGLIKPDFATLGKDVIALSFGSRTAIAKGNGTSFATPAIAGGIALLLSQHPELSPSTVRSLLRSASSQKIPDNAVGYGLPNIMLAAQQHNIVVSPVITFPGTTYQTIALYLRSEFPITSAEIKVQRQNIPEQRYPLQSTDVPFLYYARVPFDVPRSSFTMSINVSDSQRSRQLPTGVPIVIRDGETVVPCGVSIPDLVSDVAVEPSLDYIIPTAVKFGTPSITVPSSASGSVSILDVLGRRVYIETLSESSQVVRLDQCTPGLYSLVIVSGARHSSFPLLIY